MERWRWPPGLHAATMPSFSASKLGMSEKLHERVSCLPGIFLEHPMAGVLQHDDRDIRSDQLHLLTQESSQGLLAADRENRHGQLGLRELGEIFCGLLEGNEVGPARAHASGPSVSLRVRLAIRLRQRARLVGGEVVPEV